MKTIPLDNDYEPEKTVKRKKQETGAAEPATGLTDLKFWLSATDGGEAIHELLNVAAVERGTLGVYHCHFQGTHLREHLTDEEDAIRYPVVYLVFGDAGNVLASDPRQVVAVRRG